VQIPFNFLTGASTAQGAGLETIGFSFNMIQTIQHASNTTVPTQRDALFSARTHSFAVAGGIITEGSTVTITGAPIAGLNALITNTSGLTISSTNVLNATNSYGLTVNAQTGATNNFAARFLGGTTILATGTTTYAPLRFASGTLATGAAIIAGNQEFLTDDFYLTGTTGTTRKVISDYSYRAISALRTLDGSDELVNITANTFTVTLPTAVAYTKQYIIKNSGTGVITIATTSAQTIDGFASGVITLNQYDSITLRSDGSNWIII